MKSWTVDQKVDQKVIHDIAESNQWEIEGNDLIIKIPQQNTDVFFAALLKAWKTSEKSFRCFAAWN